MSCKLLYTTFQSVKLRLTNKVQFQADDNKVEDGELPNDLLSQIIQDAETAVEMDLRSRYAVPFRSKSKNTWDALPDHTKRAIRQAVDYKAVAIVLDTDFGRGTKVDGEPYSNKFTKMYNDQIQLLLGRDSIGRNDKIDRHKVAPPLEDLLLAASNSKADDGFRGMVLNSDPRERAVTYAEEQLNDPSTSWERTRIGGL